MKAPATRTAKSTQPASKGAKGHASSGGGKVSVSSSKPASKVASGTAAKSHAPAKTAPKKAAVSKVSARPPAKTSPAKPAPASKKAAPAAKKSTTPLPTKKTSAVASKVAATAPVAPVKTKAATAAKSAVRPSPAPSPIVIESTPRPLGKRAAKKVMMEQMTQAAVVPTHAPDAVKATFSTMNERVMTPPVPSSIQKDPKRANNWKSMPVEQLTDQDVQAMPDSEYMNEVQLAFFRRKLSLLKEDMLANAGETTEHLREDTVVVPDPADRATIEEEHALELRTRDRERKLLKKIEQAIARIDSGDYGYCEETGEAIGVGRLMARPTASLSLEAQQRRELKQKMFGD